MLLKTLLRPSRRLSSTATIPTETADAVVIGAGVVGLAVARSLSLKGRDVLVLDSAQTFGTVTSSRNSEVIHAGLYYPHNSLKARLCVRGRELMYNYCHQRGVEYRKVGKMVVATRGEEIGKLEELRKCGERNGVEGLRMVDGGEARAMEPELKCVKALVSAESGIVDSHGFMLSLLGEAESFGATFCYNTTVVGGNVEDDRFRLHICESNEVENHDGATPLLPQLILVPKLVINSAGLSAVPLAKRFRGFCNGVVNIPAAYYARGCYFTLSNARTMPFSRLIYPIPEVGGLGVHVTVDLNGVVKFGPDVEWIDGVDDISSFFNRYDYSVNSTRSGKFYQEIRKYFPNLKDNTLEAGYSGIRPKLFGPGEPTMDFVIQGEDIHGVPRLVNLLGIESPGLTASLAIAEYVASRFSR